MHSQMEKIADAMGASEYQKSVLCENAEKYNPHGLIKRGGILYAPHNSNGFIDGIMRLLYGPRADLIGCDHMVVQNRRRIRFGAGGKFDAGR